MDQLIFVGLGTAVAVYHILSPVKLMERITMLLEKLGNGNGTEFAGGAQKVRYYVRNFK